jgi:C-terminal processing protease CtpA/Prc
MFTRSFLSIMIVTSAFTLVFGQTPEAKKESDKLAELKEFSFFYDGTGSYLGVLTQEVTKDNFAKLGLREVRGVVVEKVADNSPAAAAGIQAGDVIVKINGEEITSGRKLTRLIGEIDPDHQAKVTVLRNGSEREVTATLAKRPGFKMGQGNFKFDMPDLKGLGDSLKGLQEMPMFKGDFNMPDLKALEDLPGKLQGLEKLKDLPKLNDFHFDFKNFSEFKNLPQGDFMFQLPDGADGKGFIWRPGEGRAIGVGITQLTKQLATHFGVDGGALVDNVRENSPAAKAGLKAGDIIVEADGKAVTNQFDLINTINNKKDGSVQLTVVRDGKRQTISVTPEVSKESGFFYKTDKLNG